MRKPKKRVKTTKAKKTTKTRARNKLVPSPPGTFNFDIESADFFKPVGAITGRISAKDPPWTIPKPLPQKPLEKMTRKELMEGFERFRKHHDQVIKDNRDGQRVQAERIAELETRLSLVEVQRADAIRVRDQILEIMTHASKEARFPRT